MRLEDKVAQYLEFCRYRKELDEKTLKAYRIDLRQYFTYLASDVPSKEQIEEYITYLHRKYKQKTVKRKIAWQFCKGQCRLWAGAVDVLEQKAGVA